MVAREGLIKKDLIRFDGFMFQVLSLPEKPAAGSRPDLSAVARLSQADVSLSKGEIVLLERRNETPARLPLPEEVVKILAAYLVGVRGKSELRNSSPQSKELLIVPLSYRFRTRR